MNKTDIFNFFDENRKKIRNLIVFSTKEIYTKIILTHNDPFVIIDALLSILILNNRSNYIFYSGKDDIKSEESFFKLENYQSLRKYKLTDIVEKHGDKSDEEKISIVNEEFSLIILENQKPESIEELKSIIKKRISLNT